MTATEHFRHVIAEHRESLAAQVQGADLLVSLLQVHDRLLQEHGATPEPDAITGLHRPHPGWSRALHLCLTSPSSDTGPAVPDEGIRQFLNQCDDLTVAELVLGYVETGYMRLIEPEPGVFAVWIAAKHPPVTWREHRDLHWWATWLATRSREAPGTGDEAWLRRAGHLVEQMVFRMDYPPGMTIGECNLDICRDVLIRLIARVLAVRQRGVAVPTFIEPVLVSELAVELATDPSGIGKAVRAFTLDAGNAAWHAAFPGIATAPLIRLDTDTLAADFPGLTSEPLLFLAHELRRCFAQEYHNTAWLREEVFRQDLAALFAHKRFVTSESQIRIRRNDGGLRTDIDAAMFDRKTGTLAVIELKSQDPFARSAAELQRQRDNFRQGSRQVSAVLDWINQHGADDILNRIDRRTAKMFRVHKVYPFVLGRYLAHVDPGAEPDRRVAWGSWPQLLRLQDGQPFRGNEANPIATLFTRLMKDTGVAGPPDASLPREIPLGSARLSVHASYAAVQRLAR